MQLTFKCVMQDDCERVISALAGPFLNNYKCAEDLCVLHASGDVPIKTSVTYFTICLGEGFKISPRNDVL